MSAYEFILPLDKYATSTTNRIFGEIHEVNDEAETVFVLDRGAFFTKDLNLMLMPAGTPLVPNVDFVAVHHFSAATNKFGQEVMCAIAIKNPAIRGQIAVDVRYVGGSYQNMVDPLRQIIDSLTEDGRPVNWGDIIGLPDQFNPAEHLHSVYDTFGYEHQVDAINSITEALVNGSQAWVQEVLVQFNHVMTQIHNEVDYIGQIVQEHMSAAGNVHLLTRQQLSVDQLMNVPFATSQENLAFANNRYSNPALVRQLIVQNETTGAFAAHLAANNPHNITKIHVGLSDVFNARIATKAEYNAQTYETGYVNVALMRSVVGDLSSVYAGLGNFNNLYNQVQAHLGAANPHGITKTTVGLSLVANYAPATDAQAVNSGVTTAYMTPRGTALAIAAQSPVKSFQGRVGVITLQPSDRDNLGLGVYDSPYFSTIEARTGQYSTRMDAEGFATKTDTRPLHYLPIPVKDVGKNQVVGTILGSGYALLPYSHASTRNIPSSGSNLVADIMFDQQASSVEVISFGSGSGSITFAPGVNNSLDTVWLFDRTSNPDGSGSVPMDLYNSYMVVKILYILPTARPILWGSQIKMPQDGPPDLNNGMINMVAIHYNSAMPGGQQYLLQYLGATQP